jgi:hypothetical protein
MTQTGEGQCEFGSGVIYSCFLPQKEDRISVLEFFPSCLLPDSRRALIRFFSARKRPFAKTRSWPIGEIEFNEGSATLLTVADQGSMPALSKANHKFWSPNGSEPDLFNVQALPPSQGSR